MAVALVIAGCSNSEASKKIETAMDAINDGNITKAESICDYVMKNSWNSLDVYNKCDLAICYMACLEDENTSDEAVDKMRKCYESAMEADRAAATDYINSIGESVGMTVDDIEVALALFDITDGMDDYSDLYDMTDEIDGMDDYSDLYDMTDEIDTCYTVVETIPVG